MISFSKNENLIFEIAFVTVMIATKFFTMFTAKTMCFHAHGVLSPGALQAVIKNYNNKPTMLLRR